MKNIPLRLIILLIAANFIFTSCTSTESSTVTSQTSTLTENENVAISVQQNNQSNETVNDFNIPVFEVATNENEIERTHLNWDEKDAYLVEGAMDITKFLVEASALLDDQDDPRYDEVYDKLYNDEIYNEVSFFIGVGGMMSFDDFDKNLGELFVPISKDSSQLTSGMVNLPNREKFIELAKEYLVLQATNDPRKNDIRKQLKEFEEAYLFLDFPNIDKKAVIPCHISYVTQPGNGKTGAEIYASFDPRDLSVELNVSTYED